LGSLKAQLRLVEILGNEQGSPRDYENAYHWLYNSIIADDEERLKAEMLLEKLAKLMPERVIRKAQRPLIR